MVWASVSGPAFSGSRPPNASSAGALARPEPRRPPASATARATRTGRRGASGATTSAALASFGSAMTSSATRRTSQPTSS